MGIYYSSNTSDSSPPPSSPLSLPASGSGGSNAVGFGVPTPRLPFATHFEVTPELVASGAFGKVHSCVPTAAGAALIAHLLKPGEPVPSLVVKCVMPSSDPLKAAASAVNISREIAEYERAWRHENITRCLGVFSGPLVGAGAVAPDAAGAQRYLIVLERALGPAADGTFVGGDIPEGSKNAVMGSRGDFNRYIQTRGGLPERVAKLVTYQLAAALESLHVCDPPIVHRDIKPENCLVFREVLLPEAGAGAAGAGAGAASEHDGASSAPSSSFSFAAAPPSAASIVPVVKLSDFGTTRSAENGEQLTLVLAGGQAAASRKFIRFVSTVFSLPPELVGMASRSGPAAAADGLKAAYGPEVDVYALGTLLYATLAGGDGPFTEEAPSQKEVYRKIAEGPTEETWVHLASCHYHRPDPPRHTKVSKVCLDLLKRMITTTSAARLSISGVLDHAWFTADPDFAAELDTFYRISGLSPSGTPMRPRRGAHASAPTAVPVLGRVASGASSSPPLAEAADSPRNNPLGSAERDSFGGGGAKAPSGKARDLMARGSDAASSGGRD